jgi:hypothetical protein
MLDIRRGQAKTPDRGVTTGLAVEKVPAQIFKFALREPLTVCRFEPSFGHDA